MESKTSGILVRFKLVGVVAAIATSFSLGGCAISGNQATGEQPGVQPQPVEKWQNFSNQRVNLTVPVDRVGVVFLRDKNDYVPRAINVYLNNEYLSSLQAGGYQYAVVCNRPVQNVKTAPTAPGSRYQLKQDRGLDFPLPAGKITYFWVGQASPTHLRINEISAEMADTVIQDYRLQANILPRLSQEAKCPTAPAVPAADKAQ